LHAALQAPGDRELRALADELPTSPADRFRCLREVYRLHFAPLHEVGSAARWQHHPVVAELKSRCEAAWITELDASVEVPALPTPGDVVPALRRLAAADRLPPLYRWLARDADREQLDQFLRWEGGPDGGFDDLVAICQVGLAGRAKIELARNYWDEMGNGDLEQVHTILHDDLVRAMDLADAAASSDDSEPVSGMARGCLGGMLASNRWLQPEMLGALGLIELQAGPRCRLVMQGLARLGAPAAAFPFYRVHAEVDPRHGADWLEEAIAPVVEEHLDWANRILRGAFWRSYTNAAFLAEITPLLREPTLATAPNAA